MLVLILANVALIILMALLCTLPFVTALLQIPLLIFLASFIVGGITLCVFSIFKLSHDIKENRKLSKEINEEIKKHPELDPKVVEFTCRFSVVEAKLTEIVLQFYELNMLSESCNKIQKDYINFMGVKVSEIKKLALECNILVKLKDQNIISAAPINFEDYKSKLHKCEELLKEILKNETFEELCYDMSYNPPFKRIYVFINNVVSSKEASYDTMPRLRTLHSLITDFKSCVKGSLKNIKSILKSQASMSSNLDSYRESGIRIEEHAYTKCL